MKKRLILLFVLVLIILPALFACGDEQEPPKPSVILSRSNLQLSVGDVYTLECTVYPSELSSVKISWTTSNSDVVSCDNGELKALALGTSVIKARAEGGNYAAVTVTVTESIRAYRNLPLGQSYEIPEDSYAALFSENEELTFFSSAPSVATCEGGVITAHSVGVADIYLKSSGKSLLMMRVTTYILETDLVSFPAPTLPITLSYGDVTFTVDGFEVDIFDDATLGPDAVGVIFRVKYTKKTDTGGDEAKNPVKFKIELHSGEVGYCTSYVVKAEDMAVGDFAEFVAPKFAADIAKGARTFMIKIVEVE